MHHTNSLKVSVPDQSDHNLHYRPVLRLSGSIDSSYDEMYILVGFVVKTQIRGLQGGGQEQTATVQSILAIMTWSIRIFIIENAMTENVETYVALIQWYNEVHLHVMQFLCMSAGECKDRRVILTCSVHVWLSEVCSRRSRSGCPWVSLWGTRWSRLLPTAGLYLYYLPRRKCKYRKSAHTLKRASRLKVEPVFEGQYPQIIHTVKPCWLATANKALRSRAHGWLRFNGASMNPGHPA